MNIYALPGFRVKLADNSRDDILKRNCVYVVKRTEVNRFSTTVWLDGFHLSFNSANLDDVDFQTPEQDKQHHDWYKYNRHT